jgi:hypothetical protein
LAFAKTTVPLVAVCVPAANAPGAVLCGATDAVIVDPASPKVTPLLLSNEKADPEALVVPAVRLIAVMPPMMLGVVGTVSNFPLSSSWTANPGASVAVYFETAMVPLKTCTVTVTEPLPALYAVKFLMFLALMLDGGAGTTTSGPAPVVDDSALPGGKIRFCCPLGKTGGVPGPWSIQLALQRTS